MSVAVRRRLIAGVLFVVGILAVVVARQGSAAPAEPAPAPRLATPLWSVRRVPQPILDGAATQRLQGELDDLIEGTDACYSVTGTDGPVVASEPATSRIPASTLKLLTAAAALEVLGPDFRYETRAVAEGRPQDGSLERLWLVGAGDPVITTPEAAARLAADLETKDDAVTSLETLADEIAAAGIRAIPGGIVGDDSRYDDTRYLPDWPSSYRANREIGPIGALTVNDGFDGPEGTGAATEPAVNAADQLARLLVARGVSVGPTGGGRAPDDATTIATLRSPPLREILTAFLSASDNLTGEMLTRELAVRADQPATTANGTAVMVARLAELGLPTAGLTMLDGSGLARDNQASCDLLVATLGLASQSKFATLRDGLAIAGERGTLAGQLQGTPLQGKLRAKTGSLSGVSGLAGFVDVKRPLMFSLLLNGSFEEGSGIASREQMAQAIGRYPDVPAPEALVPAPVAPVIP